MTTKIIALFALWILVLGACEPQGGDLTPQPPQTPSATPTAQIEATATFGAPTPTVEFAPLFLTQAAAQLDETDMVVNHRAVSGCLNVRLHPAQNAQIIDCIAPRQSVQLVGPTRTVGSIDWVQVWFMVQEERAYCDAFTPIECPWMAASIGNTHYLLPIGG